MSYGERMRELEHLSDQANWIRNLQDTLAMRDSEERLRELFEDGIWFEYEFGEFWKHPKIQSIINS